MSAYDYLGIKRSKQKDYKDSIRERDSYTCQICGEPGYDVDHIVPWHSSHDSSRSNLRVLCHRCNLIGRRNPRANPFTSLDDWFAGIEAKS